jgi:hypothetical protein
MSRVAIGDKILFRAKIGESATELWEGTVIALADEHIKIRYGWFDHLQDWIPKSMFVSVIREPNRKYAPL